MTVGEPARADTYCMSDYLYRTTALLGLAHGSGQRPDPMGKRFTTVSTEQLFDELALPEVEVEDYWERVRCLHTRGDQEVFEMALEALNGPDGMRRRAGADVLSQLGYKDDRPFGDETIPHLLARLGDSSDPDALFGIAGALGHLGFGYDEAWDENRRQALPRLRQLSSHEDDPVREATVAALKSAISGSDELSIEAALLLCELTRDPARDVRDWATFWLEGLPDHDIDLPEIRDALLARVSDEDQEIRVQAIHGLAQYRDRSVIPFLIEEIEREARSVETDNGPVWTDLFEAATALADTALLPALRVMEMALDGRGRTNWCKEAIVACEGSD